MSMLSYTIKLKWFIIQNTFSSLKSFKSLIIKFKLSFEEVGSSTIPYINSSNYELQVEISSLFIIF